MYEHLENTFAKYVYISDYTDYPRDRLRLKPFSSAMVSMLNPSGVQRTRRFIHDNFTIVNIEHTRQRKRSTTKRSGKWLEPGTRMKQNKKKRHFLGDSRNESIVGVCF